MWWHLKMGQVIWDTHTIPAQDLFSYTTNHHAYIAHEWLSQLLLYAAYRAAGYPGLMLWLVAVTAAILIAGYGLCARYSGNAKVALLGAMLVWLFATIGMSLRPQMLGYLVLLVELHILLLGATRDRRWFLTLPPLFALWINLHGSFFLGLAVAAILLASAFLPFESGSLVAPRWEPATRRLFTWSLLASIPALFLNPIGYKLVVYPLDTLLRPSIGMAAVEEWQPLQLNDARGLAFLAVVGLILLLPVLRAADLRWHELLLLGFAAWLAAGHRRLLFPFGILAAPILTRQLAAHWDNYDPEQDRPWINGVLIAASLAIAFWAFPARQDLVGQVEAQSPVRALDFIESHHLAGPMLNDWVFGGYLLWAAPDHPVFIDGRGDIFEWAGVLGPFGQWAQLQVAPNLLLDRYGIEFCLLSRNAPMTHVLPLLPHWRQVYTDQNAAIFVRSAPVPGTAPR